ncbi:unnamed protein product [Ceratitis capitata]|uniref:(Mediterranean fruit fly) hypothetical protein n=1 Tax=Ceratitis capitata TaxID=7213 RepID=A0A811V4N0_CERCA|nr:unnamed protein product [Ceratitis capitata]
MVIIIQVNQDKGQPGQPGESGQPGQQDNLVNPVSQGINIFTATIATISNLSTHKKSRNMFSKHYRILSKHGSHHQHEQQVVSSALHVHQHGQAGQSGQQHVHKVQQHVVHAQQPISHGQQHNSQATHIPHIPKIKLTSVVQHVPIPHENYELPSRVQKIVDSVHQHIPQVLNYHATHKNVPRSIADAERVGKVPVIPPKVQQIVEHAHTHIPQVINHHIQQQKQQKEVVDQQNVVAARSQPSQPSTTVPSQVQEVIQNVNKHIPQMIQYLTQQAQKLQDFISKFQQQHKIAQDIGAVGQQHSQVVLPQIPSKVQKIVEQAHKHIPQVINHAKQHKAQVQKQQQQQQQQQQGVAQSVADVVGKLVDHIQQQKPSSGINQPGKVEHQHIPQVTVTSSRYNNSRWQGRQASR